MMTRVAGTLSLLTMLVASVTAWAQGPQGYGMPPGLMGGGMPPGMMGGGPGMGGPPGMMGGPGMGPAGPGMNGMRPGAMQAGYVEGAMQVPDENYVGGGCPDGSCGEGAEYDGRYGLLGDCHGFRWLRYLAPDADGGVNTLRWFDVSADFLLWTRDDVGANRVLSTFGSANVPPNPDPVALQTGAMNFRAEPAFRTIFNMQLGSGSSAEFVYFGPFNHAAGQTVGANGNLFTLYSNFGVNPPGGFNQNLDAATFQRMGYSTELDNFEVNYRNRWQATNGRYQGSWLVGARYLKIDEDFLFESVAANGMFSDLTNTNNSLTGGQIGGDVWICPIAGLRLGAEGKVGVFGNYTRSGSITRVFDAAGNVVGLNVVDVNSTDAAFVGQLDLMATYRINYHWTFKAGYNFLVVEGISLATENISAVNPFAAVRPQSINHNGDALYHGLSLGAEYLW